MAVYQRRLLSGIALAPPVRRVRISLLCLSCVVRQMLTSIAATSVSTTASVTTKSATTTATVPGHLSQTGIDLLLSLLEDINEITCLLGVYSCVSKDYTRAKKNDVLSTHCQW